MTTGRINQVARPQRQVGTGLSKASAVPTVVSFRTD